MPYTDEVPVGPRNTAAELASAGTATVNFKLWRNGRRNFHLVDVKTFTKWLFKMHPLLRTNFH